MEPQCQAKSTRTSYGTITTNDDPNIIDNDTQQTACHCVFPAYLKLSERTDSKSKVGPLGKVALRDKN